MVEAPVRLEQLALHPDAKPASTVNPEIQVRWFAEASTRGIVADRLSLLESDGFNTDAGNLEQSSERGIVTPGNPVLEEIDGQRRRRVKGAELWDVASGFRRPVPP